ncbi:YpiF family protein [Bacillus testis]|uniref:YpiF family protein n=1 Tax=Bacillus testis TaxID=1622072 RepID=UPI00067F06E3|nr:YpiF family protein [Bacillus testis]
MKWTAKDMEMYSNAKEYVDTVILPLVGIDFRRLQSGSEADYITILAQEIERQFKGRVLLLPAMIYNAGEESAKKQVQAEEWVRLLTEEGFAHVFLLTGDPFWKKEAKELDEQLITLPAVPLETMDESYKRDIIAEQVKKTLNMIIEKWAG